MLSYDQIANLVRRHVRYRKLKDAADSLASNADHRRKFPQKGPITSDAQHQQAQAISEAARIEYNDWRRQSSVFSKHMTRIERRLARHYDESQHEWTYVVDTEYGTYQVYCSNGLRGNLLAHIAWNPDQKANPS